MDTNALKTVSKNENELRVSNYMVLFGGKDLTGEHFTPQTDFESDYTKSGVLYVDWEHGIDPDSLGVGKDSILGTVDWKTARIDERGIFVERVLNRRNQYMQYLEELIDAGLIGNSSEAAEYEKEKTGEIKTWRLKRDSLTVMPAEPRMMSANVITAMKSLGLKLPADAVNESNDKAQGGQDKPEAHESKGTNIQIVEKKGVKTMSDENATQTPAPEYATKDDFAALSGQLDQVLKHIQDAPAIKNSGYVSQDGGKADPNIKSFGDWLTAVMRGDHVRLSTVYKSQKTLNESNGGAGAFTVPEEYNTSLYTVAYETSPILNMVTRVPVNTKSGTYPSLDVTVAPTAGSGNTALAGGVAPARRKEGGTYVETEPAFNEIKWDVNDFASGYTQTTKELKADSPQAIEALLTSLFGIAVASKLEYGILRGSGIGEPLGILNAGAKVAVTPATNNLFSYVDAVTMASKFKKMGGRSAWMYHPSIMPDFADAAWAQGHNVMTLDMLGLGNKVTSEHLPQANNSGCVILADFAAYLLFLRGTLEISYSEHYGFISGKDTWRFSQRADGQPWLRNAITLADPQGSYTVSPFVYLND